MKSLLTSCVFVITLVNITASQTKSVDSEPVVQGTVNYTMPESAIAAEIDGTVLIIASVDETGRVTSANLGTDPLWPCNAMPVAALAELTSSLTDVITKLQFAPATKDGKPIAQKVSLKVTLKNPRLAPVVDLDATSLITIPRQVNGGVLNRLAKDFPQPPVPEEAKANRDGGLVSVLVLVDEEGTVIRAGAVGGVPSLRVAARTAACRAKFLPTVLAGTPVKMSGVLRYHFQYTVFTPGLATREPAPLTRKNVPGYKPPPKLPRELVTKPTLSKP